MKQLAAYCRVSTDRQKDEQTIDVQKTFIEDWAKNNDSSIIEWYMDDGWSGELLARPDLDRLRDDADKGIWKGIVILDRDRLGRKLSLQELVIDELVEKGIEVIFLNEPLADNPEGRIMQQIKGVFAEYERAKIAERMRRGKIHKAKSGILVGHNAPYGYKYVLKVGDKEGYFVINEAEAEIVKMIFHWVADDGFSMRRVVKELYLRKIEPPKQKNKSWSKSVIERLLKREDYIGTSYYNKSLSAVPKHPKQIGGYKKIKKSSRLARPREDWIAIEVPPIIDKDLFYKAHQRLKENVIYNVRNKTYDYLLSGKVYCKCGAKRVGDGVNGHHYYRCAARIYKYPVQTKCTYDGVNAEILDAMVWNKFLKLLSDKELIKSQIERRQRKMALISDKSENGVDRIETAMNKLSDEEARYTQAFGANLIDFEKYKSLVEGIKAKKETLQEQIVKLAPVKNTSFDLNNLDDVCGRVLNDLKLTPDERKQEYLRTLISSIYVGERSVAEVNGRIPIYSSAQNIQDVPQNRNCRSS